MQTKYILIVLYLLFIPPFGGSHLSTIAPLSADTPSRAHVRINDEAATLLKQARLAQAQGDWLRAASVYQKVIDAYSGYVVAPPGSSDTYQDARYAALAGLKAMPAEAKQLYRQLVDPLAKPLFESGATANSNSEPKRVVSLPGGEPPRTGTGERRLEALSRVVEHYLFSSYGERALTILSSHYLEQGDVFKATQYLNIVDWFYVPADIPKPLQANIELLNKLAALPAEADNDWLTYAGNNARSRLPQVNLGGGTGSLPPLAWVFPDDSQPGKLLPPPQMPPNPQFQIIRPMAYQPDAYLPYFPVVADSRLYLPGLAAIYAFSLSERCAPSNGGKTSQIPPTIPAPTEAIPRSGGLTSTATALAPDWQFDIPRDDSVQFLFDDRVIYTTTFYDNRLYTSLVTSYNPPEKQLGWLDVKYPFPNRTLFCFDAHNGKIVWSSQHLTKISLNLAPAVEGDALYIGGTRIDKQTDLPEYYVYCLDAATGAVRWSTFVASGLLETNLFNNPSRQPVNSAVTLVGDTVYFCANIGVVAALNRYDGRIRWLSRYRQFEIPPVRNGYEPYSLPLQWTNSPIIVSGNQVLVTPVDSPYLLSLSSSDGKILWQWNGGELGGTRYLLGASNELVVLSGNNAITCLNAGKQGKREWVIANKPFRGKGVMTQDRVYAPTLDALLEIALQGGKLLGTFQWASPRHCGNLILLPGYLISTSSDHLYIFPLDKIRSK